MSRAKFTAAGLLAINPAALGIDFLICGPLERKNRAMHDVAIVDIRGPLEHHAGGPFDSYDAIKDRVREALASSAPAVVLCFDSPGGLVSGVYETSRELRAMAAAARKPLYSYASGECASAAYALACAGERIFVPVGATLGSIGVIALSVDATAADRAMGMRFEAISSGRRKTDGNPHVAISEESRAAMQATVDAQASVFFELVAGARGMSVDAVSGFQAGIFVGQQAIEVGLADDAFASLDELTAQISAGQLNTQSPALASTAKENGTMGMKEIRKALGEAAAGDGDEAKKCRKALAALDGEEDADKDKKKDDEAASDDGEEDADKDKKKDDEAKAKAEEEAAAKAKSDDEAAKAKASTSGDPVLALAAEVQSLSAKMADRDEKEERARLLALRPDFKPEVIAVLAKKPLDTLRFAVETFPKQGAARQTAAVTTAMAATRGEGQGDPGDGVRADYSAAELDVQMGLAPPLHAIKNEGTRLTLGVMTPEQARAVLASRSQTQGR